MDETARGELIDILDRILELTPRLRSDALSAIPLSPVERLELWKQIEDLEERARQIIPPNAN
jgi:hypothetical protein